MIFGYTSWAFFWMLTISAAGMAFAIYGKKRPDSAAFVTGLALMGYTYFIHNAVGLVLIALGIGAIFALGRKWQWF